MNYKKILAFVSAAAAGLSLYSCGNSDTATSDTQSDPEVTVLSGQSDELQETPGDTEPVQDSEKKLSADEEFFSSIDSVYVFSGGSGDWSTEISLDINGQFEGVYSDKGYETDENGFAVPVLDYCGFRGSFSKLKKVDELTYSVLIKDLAATDDITPATDYILKYTDQPYGLEDGHYFTFFLAGTEISSLPDECFRWLNMSGCWEDTIPEKLEFDVLFNNDTEYAFRGMKKQEEPELPADPAQAVPGSYEFKTDSGDWMTEFELNEDGSFSGTYYDTDSGTDEDGDPYVSTEYCKFSGKFSEAQQADDLTYKMKLESLELSEELPEDEEDEYGYFYAGYAFGLSESSEYVVYMPGTAVSSLPEGCTERLSSACGWDEESVPETIPFIVLYNDDFESTFAFIHK